MVTASSSAAFHAIFSGLMIWMIGPLLMTLFQVDTAFETSPQSTEVYQQAVPVPGDSISAGSQLAADAEGWLFQMKSAFKGLIDSMVAGETRSETL
ncbi:MAG: hypothetical protein GY835_24100, partial [bacterium]|nr:hypothetical protein [bacterium]